MTTIGLLVHVYSIGYMSHDPGYWRFFAYLNLFMFSMLLLVLAGNFLVVFVAWELVGLSQLPAHRLLVPQALGGAGGQEGVHRQPRRRRRVRARDHGDLRQPRARSTSARSSTRIGDARSHDRSRSSRCWSSPGAMGKSAQFPLHVWLPDAMEGPTPVSALIHAATMVNAGVYLVARANPIFAHAPSALVVVAAIGIFTAILAASIAMTQTDIKRVLAYSTLSQLGYMFAALGVGAWTAAIFHLMTHGFFKGLLFLDSGSVIHAVHEEQDMRKMGGLSKKIPITYVTMLIGSLAIAGIPPLAGFFSKDEILGESFKHGFLWVWAIGFVVAGLTAFYMFRLMGLTFWGTFRGPKEVWDKIHESPPVDDHPADPAGHPVGLPGHRSSGCRSARAGSPSGSRRSSRRARRCSTAAPRSRAYALFGIDGVADPRQRHHRGHRHRHRLAAVRRRASGRSGCRPDPERVRELTRPGAVPLPRVAQQVVVRRPQPPAVHGHRRQDRGGLWWFDREVVDGTVNAHRRARRSTPGAGSASVQTGRVQNYALGIAIGLIVMAGSYLLLAGR